MKCGMCKREMTQLFLTQACDYCDFGLPKEKLHRGFIVPRNPIEKEPVEEYVFKSELDAQRWAEAIGIDQSKTQEVYSLSPFRWHLSRGTLRDVVLADTRFEVFPDHRYEPLPHRCFLGTQTGPTNS